MKSLLVILVVLVALSIDDVSCGRPIKKHPKKNCDPPECAEVCPLVIEQFCAIYSLGQQPQLRNGGNKCQLEAEVCRAKQPKESIFYIYTNKPCPKNLVTIFERVKPCPPPTPCPRPPPCPRPAPCPRPKPCPPPPPCPTPPPCPPSPPPHRQPLPYPHQYPVGSHPQPEQVNDEFYEDYYKSESASETEIDYYDIITS